MVKKTCPNIGKIINNEYLRDFLTNRIASKALEEVKRRQAHKKAGRNKAFKYRSSSVVQKVPNRVKQSEEAILKEASKTAASTNVSAQNSFRTDVRSASALSTIQPSSHRVEVGRTSSNDQGRMTHHRFYDNKALQYIHDMRMDAFDRRCEENRSSVKPYLPMLISDEKEVMEEQLLASKNQLNGKF